MDVAEWLAGLGLEQYQRAFRDNEIDAEILRTLTPEDLKDLGIEVVGHRRKLLNAIEAMGDGARNLGEASGLSRATVADPPASPPMAEPAPRFEAERRQLTVLFCDLVDSTTLSATLDPEEMREVIREYQDTCAGVITRFEGFVAKFMGDGVLAYFGYPRAHEDAAERAVRAGLALTEAIARQKGPSNEPLAARIGIATGVVVVGDLIGKGASQEQPVVGETPNLAARLQSLAEPGAVVIGEGTRHILGALFDLEDSGVHALKGFAQPVRAWRVLGEGRAEGRFEALHAGGLAALVGRDQELALLLDRWELAKSGEGQVVLLSGEAGIGKSRLTQALRDRIGKEPHSRLRYFCSPYHMSSALYPIIEQLERAAEFEREDGNERKLDKLEALLGEAMSETTAVAPLFAALLSLDGSGRYPALDLTPQAQKARTFQALLQQMEGLAARRPVLMVLEDAHWLDPTTRELFELAVDRIQHRPVLLVATFRPDSVLPWTGFAHVTVLSLNRLSRRQGAAIIERVSGGKPLPEEIVEQILAKTDGVPLFVEELTKAVLESGLLDDAGDHYALDGPLPALAIPSTLRDSLMARLDRLAPVKEVAQIASVIGRDFEHRLLSAVVDQPEPDVIAALDRLAEAELIFRRGSPPDATYTFKHALVQDAAYGSLLKSSRQRIHGKIATTLEADFPQVADAEPETLAKHFSEAGLADKAISFWRRASERAAERSALEEATAHAAKALELLQQQPESESALRLEITLDRAFMFMVAKGWGAPETDEAFKRARELCDRVGDRSHLAHVLWGEYTVHLLRGELDRASEKTEEMLAEAQGVNDAKALMMAHRSAGTPALHAGRFESAAAHMQHALSLFDTSMERPIGHRFGYDARVVSLVYCAHALLHLGYPDRASALCQEALSEARSISHPSSLVFALGQTSNFFQYADDLEAHAEHFDETIETAVEQAMAPWETIGRLYRGYLAVLDGHAEAGLAEMQDGFEKWLRPGNKLFVSLFFLVFAKAHAALDEIDKAMDYLSQALALIEETGEGLFETEAHRFAGEMLLAGPTPDAEAAERRFQTAIKIARHQKAKWPEIRAATDLARLWGEQGKPRQGADLLRPVLDWFTEGFDTKELKKARAVLIELDEDAGS